LDLPRIREIDLSRIFTHDLIGVGKDGPKHQPVEQLAHMRFMPGLIMSRPADANEATESWRTILQLHHEPAVLVLTRQAVPTIDRKNAPASGLVQGACILADAPDGALRSSS
jgi:transketolase